jgi:FkbH-like protein
MKGVLLSNINMDPLLRTLRPWNIAAGTYNSLLADLANDRSVAVREDVTHVFCLYDSDTLLGDAFYGSGHPESCEQFLSLLDSFCARYTSKVMVANLLSVSSNRWLGFADALHPESLKKYEAAFNESLVTIAKKYPNLLLIDINLLFRRYGESALLSNAFWYAARIRYTARMFELMANMIRPALEAHAQRVKKVLLLDLDDTLWGGIVGERGPHGIALSQEDKGRCYRDFQRCIKALTRTGVLLAIVSKNNVEDVDEVFHTNKMMILQKEDFAAIRINWRPKVENIAEIAEELSLGTDSFVYIDDNPVECEAVRKFMPEVAVPDFPTQAENLPSWFMQEVAPIYFGKYVISKEDAAKTQQYRANHARRQLAATFDLDAYLAGLGIECSISADDGKQLVRASQMTQKTNQFNLTTRRYEISDLTRFVENHDHAVLLLDYRDRFGDEGCVGMAIIDLAASRIDTLLMSCRVIGRKVEDRLLDKAIDLCRTRGHPKIVGEYIPSRKNKLVADFYDKHGFTPVTEHSDGRIVYEKVIDDRRQ